MARQLGGKYGTVYVLTNFNSTIEEDLWRIYALRENYDPFVMVYDKPNAAPEMINLQRWCNNRFVFKKVPRFEDYDTRKRGEMYDRKARTDNPLHLGGV